MRSGLRVLGIEPSNIKLILGILSGGKYSCYLGKMVVMSVVLFGCPVTLASDRKIRLRLRIWLDIA